MDRFSLLTGEQLFSRKALSMQNNIRFLVFSVIGTVALMRLLVLPAMIGVLVDEGGLDEVTAGWLTSMGALGGAIVAMVMAFYMHRINPRKIAVISLSVAIVAEIMSAYSVGPTVLFFTIRIIAGIAIGAAYVIAIAAIARLENFERGYGIFVTLQFIVSGLGLYILPVYSSSMGVEGMYFGFAGLDALALALTPFISTTAEAETEKRASLSEWRVILSVVTVAAVMAFAFFEMANNAQFTYIERFGVSLSLTDETIGTSLLIGSLIGIPGAFSIVFLGQRFGTIIPLNIGIGAAVAGLLVLIFIKTAEGFLLGGCLLGFSWAFCLPYIHALLAELDREGSAVAAGSSASSLGGALGPAFAANVVGQGSYINVFTLTIGLFIVALILFTFTHLKSKQQAEEALL